jgi:adenylosuccinate lyase
MLPEAFLIADELLLRAGRILAGLRIDADAIRRTLETYGTFAATERLLMEAARSGGDRQALHEAIREHSMAAWDALRQGQSNPLAEALSADERITAWVPAARVRDLLRADAYVGDAPERARAMAATIRQDLQD